MIHYLFMGNEQTHPLHATDKNILDYLIKIIFKIWQIIQ